MELKFPEEKIKTKALHFLAISNIPAQSLTKFLGKLNATSPAL